MPELPEVENVVRGLRAALVGAEIRSVEVLWARSVRDLSPAAFARRLQGQVITDVRRRGKWLIFDLNGDGALLAHLRMTGRLTVESEACLDDRYLRVLFLLDDGRRLHFSDMRKFGRLWLVDDPAEALQDLGPEPLAEDFTVARFEHMLRQRRGRIKPLLLNQRFLVGLGNIYTDEALWRAGIHPLRPANSLSAAEVRRLHHAIQGVLGAAIDGGGTTLSDAGYVRADGSEGEFVDYLAVYGRAGERCPRCAEMVERIVVGQRGTHFCPRCQPERIE
jgi:formamidopyrimidine-DNA glycosylase